MDEAARLIGRWRKAYELFNKQPAPIVHHERGWFYIGGYRRGRGKRASDLSMMVATLEGRMGVRVDD